MKQSRRILLVVVVSAIMVVGSLHAPWDWLEVPAVADAASVSAAAPVVTRQADAGASFTDIYDSVSPSVVAISVTTTSRNRVVSSGTGSGFVLDREGHIVTNDHVVDGATQIEVEFFDGTLAWATVIGADADSDLAVLHVDVPAEQLYPVQFGDSDALEVGQTVLALGSPFGQNWTLTSGIISGLGRTIQGLSTYSIGSVIQTDAAINPGNSGGPLLDLAGRVIGVNSQIMSSSKSSAGVGFAIPSNLAQRVVGDLIADGKTEYSYLGISGGDVTLSLLDALGLPSNTRGVVVSEVTAGGPAGAAGLRSMGASKMVAGQSIPTQLDIITAIDGYALKGMEDLISYLARATVPGQTVQLTVLRNGSEWLQVPVALTARP